MTGRAAVGSAGSLAVSLGTGPETGAARVGTGGGGGGGAPSGWPGTDRRAVLASVGWLGLVFSRVVLAPEGSSAGRGARGPGWVGSCGGRGAAARLAALTGGRAARPFTLGRLCSSGRSISPKPRRFCRRRAQRGAHQQSSPSNFITDGTRNIRTTVASSSSAAIKPNARYFIITRSENTNAPMTITRINAAA